MDGITDLMHISLGKLQELVMCQGPASAGSKGYPQDERCRREREREKKRETSLDRAKSARERERKRE